MELLNETQLNKFSILVNKLSPIIYHHPDEKYYPVSIEWLMKNSTLIDYTTINSPIIISPVSNIDMYEIAAKYNFEQKLDGSILFSFGSELYKGEHPTRNVPCYALIRKIEDKLYITYIYLYAYNGEYPILGLENAGYHPADMEHMTLELDANTEQLLRVMYSAHGVKDGRWVLADQVPMENGKIVAYMALNGHGLYPQEGIAFRLGGLSNDYLVKGAKWEPRAELIFLPNHHNFNIETMGWVAFNGRFGGEARPGNTDGIAPLIDKGWIRDIDILDNSLLTPPVIFSPIVGNALITVKNIIAFIIVYFIIYKILTLSDKYIISPSDGIYGWKEHIITIMLFLFLLVISKNIVIKIIKKFAPS